MENQIQLPIQDWQNWRIPKFSANTVMLTDGYKPSHWLQLPKDTEYLFSFFESRGGLYPKTTSFGLQYLLKRYFCGQVITLDDIHEANDKLARYYGNPNIFNKQGWIDLYHAYDGRLPLEIRAIPEGTRVPTHNVLLTAVNTDKRFPWITNYMETMDSLIWYPTTVATQSRAMKDTIIKYLKLTSDTSECDYMLHCFGFRGSTSVESAAIGTAAHGVNFRGSDTLPGIPFLEQYYHAIDPFNSVPAAEHSTVTSHGRENECRAYEQILDAFPTGIVSIVSDSYDVFNTCKTIFGTILRDKILARAGVLVVRPDSGPPPKVVVKVLDILGDRFGFTVNSKGYKVLNPKVRVLQGDGIDPDMVEEVLKAMMEAGWSAENIVFGSGGGLLQKVNRDTLKFAFKCCAVRRGGHWMDVIKDPVTDPGKKSKAGRLILVRDSEDDDDSFRTVRIEDTNQPNLLPVVFRNGELIIDYDFNGIVKRAAA